MFAGWSNVYTLLGSASAGLVGLLFVVSTLVSSIDPARRLRGLALFLTPTVFKFASVLALSVIALAPGLSPTVTRLLAAGVGVVGLVNLGNVTLGLLRSEWTSPLHWSDPWCYGLVPTAAFAAIAVCAVTLEPVAAGRAVAAAALVILLLGIRNAWDLLAAMSGSALARKPDGEGT